MGLNTTPKQSFLEARLNRDLIEDVWDQFRCVTYGPKHYVKYQKDFESVLFSYTEGRLSSNYTRSSFFKDHHLLFSIIYQNNEAFEVSTAMTRPQFNGSVRVLNRLLVRNDLRSTVWRKSLPRTTLTMLEQQTDLLTNGHTPPAVFVSREFKNSHRFVRHFAQSARQHSGRPWTFSPTRHLVAGQGKEESNWQWVSYLEFGSGFNLAPHPST